MHEISACAIKKYIIKSITILFFLTACQTNQTRTPLPTAEVFGLYHSPALGYLRENISSCISSVGTIVPYLHEQSTGITRLATGEVVLTLGEAKWDDGDYFVTQIGEENIVFIINASNPVDNIPFSEVKNIFSGKTTKWQFEIIDEQQISVWSYPIGSDLSDWLSESFLENEGMPLVSKLAPNPRAVMDAVSQDVGAIGYLPESWLKRGDSQIIDDIKILSMVDTIAIDKSLPILAYSRTKPVGGIRELLLCLTEK